MAKHVASVAWQDDGGFSTGRYSRAHEMRFDGGAVVRGSSSPHVVPLPFSDPAGIDPEEALIASATACHMLWFLNLAQEAGLHVTRYEDEAEGTMERVGRGRQAITRIVLRPRIAFSGREPGADELQALHHEAHERCFIANSLKSEIVVEPPAELEFTPAT
jgi:organic hydroperoxide reductase OsmC/OhrA